jgi:ankyrin repeat protein
MYAAEDGLDNIVNFLIINGANVDIKDNKGNTAWFYAISNLHLDTAQIIANQ